MDYATTAPYYKALGERFVAATGAVEGMEKSCFPLREMHGLTSLGSGRSIEFDDVGKRIIVSAKVVDPTGVAKVKSGTLIGFSHGGGYVKTWDDPDFPGCTRYTADISEISLVDSPCLPSALIDSIKARQFELRRVDGTIELRKFSVGATPMQNESTFAENLNKLGMIIQNVIDKADGKKTKRVAGEDLTSDCFAFVGDKNDPETWKLPIKFNSDAKTKAHIRNALARFGQTQGIPDDKKDAVKRKIQAAAKEHGIEVSDEAEKMFAVVSYLAPLVKATGVTVSALVEKALAKRELKKGLYTVARMAEVVQSIAWLRESVAWEREVEGDASTAPESFAQLLEDAAACFLQLAEEETQELIAAVGAAKGEKAMKVEDLEKAQADLKAAQDGLAKGKNNLSALHGHLNKIHAHAEKMAAHHEKMHKAHSDIGTLLDDHGSQLEEMAKGAPDDAKSDLQAAANHLDKCMKAHAKLGEMHKAHAEMHKAHAEHIAKAMDACKAAMEDKESEKAAPLPELTKAENVEGLAEAMELLKAQQKTIEDLKASVEKAAAKLGEPAAPAAPAAPADPMKEIRDLMKAQADQIEDLKKKLDPTHIVKGRLIPRPGEGGGSPEDVLKVQKAAQAGGGESLPSPLGL